MPVISMFYGVIVLMYYFDNRQHQVPHIHVKYSGEEAVITIPDGEVLEGSIKCQIKISSSVDRNSSRRINGKLGISN